MMRMLIVVEEDYELRCRGGWCRYCELIIMTPSILYVPILHQVMIRG